MRGNSFSARRRWKAARRFLRRVDPDAARCDDHLLANPVVVLLAIGGALDLTADEKPGFYLFGFVAVTYLPMCSAPHGVNLRYATIWDVPLTYLALLPIFRWAQGPGVEVFRRALLIVLVSAVALTEIQNYVAIFVDNAIYDPVTAT